MASTLAVSDKTRKEIQIMKIEEGYTSVDEMIRDLIIEHKRSKFSMISETFRKRMKQKKLALEDLIH